MGGEEHVLESVSAENDFVASGKLVNAVENLIPGVLRHQTDERIQADDSLFIEMVENCSRENIAMGIPLFFGMYIQI
jgi:hypothetical protein